MYTMYIFFAIFLTDASDDIRNAYPFSQRLLCLEHSMRHSNPFGDGTSFYLSTQAD